MAERLRHLVLTTPEGVTFRLPLAGPVSRLLALTVDYAVVAVVLNTVMSVVQIAARLHADIGFGAMILLNFLVPMLYSLLMEGFWRGQTLGKRLLRLRVVDADGLKLQFSQVVVRNLLRAVDSLPLFYLIGGASAFLTRRAQRLGDLAANTVVVRIAEPFQPDLATLAADKYNSLRAQPLVVSRLRQKFGGEEASLLLRALARRERLDPGERVALYRELADLVRTRVKLPPEAVVGQSDEQLLRNVVDVLFRR